MHVKTSFSLFAVCLSIALPAARPIYADDKPLLSLQDILARHLQALGKHDDSSVAERETGTYESGGVTGTYSILSKGHSKYLEEYKLGPNDTLTGSDGQVTWQRDSNGGVRLLSTEELKNEKTDQYIGSASYAVPGRLPGTQTLRPQTEKRTGDYIVDIVPADGKPATLFFDPKTFLIVKDQHMDDDLLITTTYSDFKMLNGVMTATTERVSNGDKKYDDVYHTETDVLGVDAPDTLFAMPPVAKNFQWLTKDASAMIPFDANDQAIILYVGLNGRPAYLILDSGAGDFAIDRYATDTLKIPREGTQEARGYGGSTNIYPVKLTTFEIPDGVLFSNITATAIDMPKGYNFYQSVPTIGFIGYTLLSRFIVQVNYADQNVTLYDPDQWKPSAADGAPLPMELDDNVPNIAAQLDGLPPARFLVDTGDSGCVRLYTPFVAQNKLSAKYPKGMETTGMGVGGETRSRRVRVGSFALAGTTLKNVPTELSLDAKSGSSQILAGALGHEFLSHFTVTFDYAHRRIFFAPNADTPKPFDTRSFGIYTISRPDDLVKNKHDIIIVYVEPDSPADKAGLQPGTVITQVDGQSSDDLGLGEVRRLLSPEGGKDAHQLTIIGPNGGTGKVTVKMYDPMPGVTQ